MPRGHGPTAPQGGQPSSGKPCSSGGARPGGHVPISPRLALPCSWDPPRSPSLPPAQTATSRTAVTTAMRGGRGRLIPGGFSSFLPHKPRVFMGELPTFWPKKDSVLRRWENNVPSLMTIAQRALGDEMGSMGSPWKAPMRKGGGGAWAQVFLLPELHLTATCSVRHSHPRSTGVTWKLRELVGLARSHGPGFKARSACRLVP